MEQKPLNIVSGKLFPFHFQFLGYALLVIGLVAIIASFFLVGVVLFIIGGVIVTATRGLQFHQQRKHYRVYYALFF